MRPYKPLEGQARRVAYPCPRKRLGGAFSWLLKAFACGTVPPRSRFRAAKEALWVGSLVGTIVLLTMALTG